MLYEDEVVDAVAEYLQSRGWTIISTARATQHGDDVVATLGDTRLVVEAKGEGSSKEGSRRYGRSFTGNQVKSHVSVAVMRALKVASEGAALSAVAFPDNLHHHGVVDPALSALHRAGVGVFWVNGERQVSIEAPWPAVHEEAESSLANPSTQPTS